MFEDFFGEDLFDSSEAYDFLDQVTYIETGEDAGEFFAVDLTGDGYAETLVSYVDIDGDGIIDGTVTLTDTNYDGYADVYGEHTLLDTTGDGMVDTLVNHYDTTGDGFMDIREAIIDTDGDGVFDKHAILSDTTGDGFLDNYQEINYMDTTGDGMIDTITVENDFGNNGVVDFAFANIDSNHDGFFDMTMHYPLEATDFDGLYPPNFDLDNEDIDWDNIIGDPAADMENWHMQIHEDTCAVVSQEFVLQSLLGEDFHEYELRDIALENDWYSEGGGTPMEHVGNLLEMYGLEVEKNNNGTVEDITTCLENGGSVIVGLDADEIWSSGRHFVKDELLTDSPFAPGAHPNHAVQVIGIDNSDPDNVMIILNDPGIPNGCGAMIPIDEFMGAWEDSGYFLVTAYK